MELPKYFNVVDFVKIGIIALAFIFIANYALGKIGLTNLSVKA